MFDSIFGPLEKKVLRLHFSGLALLALALSSLLSVGCKPPQPPVEKKSETGIFGQKTDKIGEFDPNKPDQVVSDGAIDEDRMSTPLIGGLAAYGPMLEKISKLYIEQAVNLFFAEHGRYPKDYAEFKEHIIDANHIQLPVLPGGAEYQYDVQNHCLVIVEKK
jgi:hypothetical protein